VLSPVQIWAEAVVRSGIDLEHLRREFTPVQLAAFRYDWERWARPKQLIPQGKWRSWGFLTGRGFGKTRAESEFVVAEAMAGRANRIGLCAQNEEKTVEVLVEGESGLVNVSPHHFKARFEPGNNRVVFPNGAQAFVYTPQEPQNLRGPEHHLFLASELVAWPAATRQEAFSNIRLGLRLGYGKLLWDTTPKRKHPLIRYLLARALKSPELHHVIRGKTLENTDNLAPDVVAEWIAEYGGTQQGREELEGEFSDDDDGALWRQEWIDKARRFPLISYVRRIISVDPAISTRKGTDQTSIMDLGRGADGQIYVIADYTAKHSPEAWGTIVLDLHQQHRCDCVVVERNRGGDLVAQNLRGLARERGLKVEVIDPKSKLPPSPQPGYVYIKEVNASRSKEIRAEPVATVYEKGRVSHIIGADLTALEESLTTWDGSGASPDRLDAVVHGVFELAGLSGAPAADPKDGFKGIQKANAQLVDRPSRFDTTGLAAALPRSQWGSRL
jgi:phage terminase large subunit-like protein